MSSNITWTVAVEVSAENRAAWEALAAEMVAATSKETGTLVYEWHWSPSGDACTVLERYVDNAAALIHAANFAAKFADRFTTIGTPIRLDAYGPVSDELVAALAGPGTAFHAKFTGFSR